MSLRGIISQRLLVKQGGGRIAAREVLINNPAISNLIRENKIAQIKTVIQTAADVGMNTMDQDLKRLFRQGAISKETWNPWHSYAQRLVSWHPPEDETLHALRKRIELFHELTAPVIEYYRKKHILVEINGEKEIEEISKDILKALKQTSSHE